MLSYVQSRLGERFDIEPGADMRAAIEAAERNGSGVALVDRDIQVTIQRFWRRLSVTEKLKMVGGLALGITDPAPSDSPSARPSARSSDPSSRSYSRRFSALATFSYSA